MKVSVYSISLDTVSTQTSAGNNTSKKPVKIRSVKWENAKKDILKHADTTKNMKGVNSGSTVFTNTFKRSQTRKL